MYVRDGAGCCDDEQASVSRPMGDVHCDTNTTISAGVVHDGWFEVSARFHRYLDKSRGAAMHTMPGWDIQVRIRTTGLCAL